MIIDAAACFSNKEEKLDLLAVGHKLKKYMLYETVLFLNFLVKDGPVLKNMVWMGKK